MAKLNQKTFKEACKDSGGNQSIIARKLEKSRSTITMYLNKHPKMRALLETEAERIIDVAENVIDHDITKNKNIDSSKWKLLNSKRGKSRGYGPKQETEISGSIKATKLELELIDGRSKSEDSVSKKTDERPPGK